MFLIANMKQAVRSLDTLSVRLGNVLATKTKTAGAVPPSVVVFLVEQRRLELLTSALRTPLSSKISSFIELFSVRKLVWTL
jgi:hypothetical protein